MKLKRLIPLLGFLSAIFIAGFVFVHPTLAAALSGDQLFGGATSTSTAGTGFAGAAGLGSMPLGMMIATIIRIALGFLGILAVVFVLYGGFLYMTSGGDPERIKKAKRVLTNAAVGLVIILSAFTITQFILNSLTSATSGGDNTTTGGGVVGSGLDKTPTAFTLSSVNTQCSEGLRNFHLQFAFSNLVAGKQGIHVYKGTDKSDTNEVAGTFDVTGKKVTFIPSSTCVNPTDATKTVPCFDADTLYTYVIDPTVFVSSAGSKLTAYCTNPPVGSPKCQDSFTTGAGIDTKPPTADWVSPVNGASVFMADPDGTTLQANTTDDTGVSTVDFYGNDAATAVWSAGYLAFSSKHAVFGKNLPPVPSISISTKVY